MNGIIAVIYVIATLGSVFAAYNLSRSYTRLKAVKFGRPSLWTAGRFVGVTAGTLVWMAFRLTPPDVNGAPTTPPIIAWNVVLSFVLVTILDIVLERLFIDEPSYGESREAYLRHGEDEADDWIDALYGEAEP